MLVHLSLSSGICAWNLLQAVNWESQTLIFQLSCFDCSLWPGHCSRIYFNHLSHILVLPCGYVQFNVRCLRPFEFNHLYDQVNQHVRLELQYFWCCLSFHQYDWAFLSITISPGDLHQFQYHHLYLHYQAWLSFMFPHLDFRHCSMMLEPLTLLQHFDSECSSFLPYLLNQASPLQGIQILHLMRLIVCCSLRFWLHCCSLFRLMLGSRMAICFRHSYYCCP